MGSRKGDPSNRKGVPDKHHGDWYPAFLRALRATPNVSRAARAVGITRQAAYWAREQDPEFAREWQAAQDEGLDALEEQLMKRGKKSSDTAAIFMLKSHRREIYGDRADLNMNVRGGVIHTHRVDLSALTNEELETLELIVGKASVPELSAGQLALPAGYSD
jgi:hypothetical protein